MPVRRRNPAERAQAGELADAQVAPMLGVRAAATLGVQRAQRVRPRRVAVAVRAPAKEQAVKLLKLLKLAKLDDTRAVRVKPAREGSLWAAEDPRRRATSGRA
jgi:hypothetical protein